ncbi:MAG: outer membrane protein transport protein [Polyangiaceae bacterium]
MRSGFQKLAFASVALLGATLSARSALASNGLDSPGDAGAAQIGRGGAWIARADDPLAAYYNPAGLVRQGTGVHLGAQLMFLNRCYARTGPDMDQKSTTYGQFGSSGFPVSPGAGYLGPGAPQNGKAIGPSADVCSDGAPFPNPQLAFNYRALDKLAIGLALVGPHGVGKSIWPESMGFTNKFGIQATQPAPQRYMLTESDSLILFPTLSVAYAVNDQLSFGAGFVWGVAHAEFVKLAETISTPPGGKTCGPNKDQQCLAGDDFTRDAKAKLSATDVFVPGFVIGALYSPTNNLDVAAWFRWSDAVDTDASVNVTSLYWDQAGKVNTAPCGTGAAGCNITKGEKAGDPGYNAGHIKLNIPMEAKLGVRFHYPRSTPAPLPKWAQGTKKVRDALSEDLFDIEANFTYANNSSVQNIEVRFQKGIPINGTGGTLPENADIAHNWKDVFGVRLGGEYVIVPGLLAARAGGFYESKGQDDKYLNIDFHLGERVGLSGGASVRIGPVDVTVAYQHTFFGTLDNKGQGALYGLSGDAATSKTPGPAGAFRTYQAINGGSLKSDLNEVALGGTWRF